MPRKRANAIALLELLQEPVVVNDGPWLQDPLPLHEFCDRHLDVTPWDVQREDLSRFLGASAEDTKRLFTQDPPTVYNCGILCYGKGAGKDTLASVCLVWFAHVLLCMRDPQSFLGLAPQEPIDIALASPTLRQTRRVTFTKLKNRLRTCTWLRDFLTRPEFGITDVDRYIKKATDAADFIELPHNIRIHNLPLLSSSAEGFNLLAFVISEFAGLESEAQGATAEALFNTFVTSCRTRFRKAWKGFLTSFPRSVSDPQEQLIEAHQEGRFPELFVVRRPTWEVVPHLEYKDFESEFIRDPEGSAAKLAAQPRAATEAYFRSPDLIVRHASGGTPELMRRYDRSVGQPDPIIERDLFGDVVLNAYGFPVLASWVKGKPDREYYIHIDLGLSGDSAGFAMAHLEPVGDRDDRLIPVLDLSFRWKAAHFAEVGQLQRHSWEDGPDTAVNIRQAEIDLQTPVEFVLYLSKRLGYAIALVTFDQFNSATAKQALYHYGVASQNFSVDRNPGYYDELKGLIYGRQLIYYIDPILFGELRKLVRLSTGKVDAPRTSLGSEVDSHKDIADAVASVVGRLTKLSAASGEFYTLPEPDRQEEPQEATPGPIDIAADYSPTQAEIMREFFS